MYNYEKTLAGARFTNGFCSDHGNGVDVRVKRNFHRIWIAMEKPLVKRGPDPFINKLSEVYSVSLNIHYPPIVWNHPTVLPYSCSPFY